MDSLAYGVGVNRASRLNKTLYSLPVHCLTESDLRQENAKGVMQHFHSPENGHNRFLASLTQQERAILRQLERPALYSSRMKEDCDTSVRPSTAPAHRRLTVCNGAGSSSSSSRRGSHERAGLKPGAAQQGNDAVESSMLNKTQKGVPCYSMNMIMDVDVMTGEPASAHLCSTQPWRVRRVWTIAEPHSSYGHGEGGKRAQHQSYSHYKYYGFAGQGAKTSWASSTSKVPVTAAQ